MPDLGLRVDGLREFRNALRQAGPQWPRALQKTNKALADDVANRARPIAAATVRPHAARKRPSRLHWIDYVNQIRPGASQTSAYVAFGSAKIPWAGGAHFGSTGRYKNFPQRDPVGGPVYRAIAGMGDGIVDTYAEMIADLTRSSFPD